MTQPFPTRRPAVMRLPEPLGRQLEPHARLVEAGPGETVLGFGTRSTEVYVILEGHVRAELSSPDGHEVILGDLGPGAIFGEVAGIEPTPRPATAIVSSTPTERRCGEERGRRGSSRGGTA